MSIWKPEVGKTSNHFEQARQLRVGDRMAAEDGYEEVLSLEEVDEKLIIGIRDVSGEAISLWTYPGTYVEFYREVV